jgi:hypothetical protein
MIRDPRSRGTQPGVRDERRGSEPDGGRRSGRGRRLLRGRAAGPGEQLDAEQNGARDPSRPSFAVGDVGVRVDAEPVEGRREDVFRADGRLDGVAAEPVRRADRVAPAHATGIAQRIVTRPMLVSAAKGATNGAFDVSSSRSREAEVERKERTSRPGFSASAGSVVAEG